MDSSPLFGSNSHENSRKRLFLIACCVLLALTAVINLVTFTLAALDGVLTDENYLELVSGTGMLVVLVVIGNRLKSLPVRSIRADKSGIQHDDDRRTVQFSYEDISSVQFDLSKTQLHVVSPQCQMSVSAIEEDNIDVLLYLLWTGLVDTDNTEVLDRDDFRQFYRRAQRVTRTKSRLLPLVFLGLAIAVTVTLAIGDTWTPSHWFLSFGLATLPVVGWLLSQWMLFRFAPPPIDPTKPSFTEPPTKTRRDYLVMGYAIATGIVVMGYTVLAPLSSWSSLFG